MRSFRPAMPSAAVAASAMTSGGSTAVATARSARALRLLLWCSDSVQAGASGVTLLGPTCMSLQPVSHASCNGTSIERTAQGPHDASTARKFGYTGSLTERRTRRCCPGLG